MRRELPRRAGGTTEPSAPPPAPIADSSARDRLAALLTALSATVLMASTLGTLVWLSCVFLVTLAARSLSAVGILPGHWDVGHMATNMSVAAVVALLPVGWLLARYFRMAWRAEQELDARARQPSALTAKGDGSAAMP